MSLMSGSKTSASLFGLSESALSSAPLLGLSNSLLTLNDSTFYTEQSQSHLCILKQPCFN